MLKTNHQKKGETRNLRECLITHVIIDNVNHCLKLSTRHLDLDKGLCGSSIDQKTNEQMRLKIPSHTFERI